MKIDGSDWKDKLKEKSESEKLFDSLLFSRGLASLCVERFQITKELERLLPEDQIKFAEYLSNIIALYENECGPVLNVGEDDPVPEELKNLYFDKNTTLAQYLYTKRFFILGFLQNIKNLWNKEKTEEITVILKKTHSEDISQIITAKKRIENDFPLLENLVMAEIKESPDNNKNEVLKKFLEEMRNDFKNSGINV
jgi:hypothetical protein